MENRRRIGAFLIMVALLLVMVCLSGQNAVAASGENWGMQSEESTDYYPFVYTDAEGFEWARNIIGDCSSCEVGYLYVQDMSTREISQVLTQPVSEFCLDGEMLYCIVDDLFIVKTDCSGEQLNILYTAVYGSLDNLTICDGYLYFSDGDYIIKLDTNGGNTTILTQGENIALIYPIANSVFAWMDNDGNTYVYDVETNEEEVVDFEDLVYDVGSSEIMPTAGFLLPQALSADQVTFPLSNYPSGSYFTVNGQPCANHDSCSYDGSCNCKVYRTSIQCAAFAKYAFDQYSHISSTSSTWYPDPNSHNQSNIFLSSAADVKLLFENLGYGAYMRLSRYNSSNPTLVNPVHSAVTAGATNTSVTIYEGNADGHCKVMMSTYTFERFRLTYNCATKTVAHSFTGRAIKYSGTTHRRNCGYAGCEGYIYENHYINSGSTDYTTCAACGYVGDFPITIYSNGKFLTY